MKRQSDCANFNALKIYSVSLPNFDVGEKKQGEKMQWKLKFVQRANGAVGTETVQRPPPANEYFQCLKKWIFSALKTFHFTPDSAILFSAENINFFLLGQSVVQSKLGLNQKGYPWCVRLNLTKTQFSGTKIKLWFQIWAPVQFCSKL